MASTLLKIASSISTAILAPKRLPKKAAIPRYILKGNVLTPLLLKPAVARAVCMIIATLLVPLASVGGQPINMSTGKANKEPPPATVLIKPTTKPTTISMG